MGSEGERDDASGRRGTPTRPAGAAPGAGTETPVPVAEMPKPTTGRWVVVVRRDQAALYARLVAGLGGVRGVEVILDRREAPPPSGAPRPERERRRRRDAPARFRWRSLGYAVVPPTEPGNPAAGP